MSHFSYAPLFQGPHFFTKMLESDIVFIILHLSTFYLFDDVKIGIKLMNANHFDSLGAHFNKTHVQPVRLNFLFAVCTRHYSW